MYSHLTSYCLEIVALNLQFKALQKHQKKKVANIGLIFMRVSKDVLHINNSN